MSNIADFMRWELDGTRHRISIARSEHGCYYVIRVDGQFWSTAETLAEAGDEVADIIQANRWTQINPNVA